MRCFFAGFLVLMIACSCTQNENDRKAAEFARQMRGEAVRQNLPHQKADNPEIKTDLKPASFSQLKRAIPDRLSGRIRKNLTGHTTLVGGTPMSRAHAVYGEGMKKIDLMIVDMGLISKSSYLSEFDWYKKNIDLENENISCKTFVLEGKKAYREYNKKQKSGRIATIIHGRFGINVQGENVTVQLLLDAIDEVDIDALSIIIES